ncbi:MAG: hypothetical protein WC750_05995 [Patescibacteria group bacterium]
MNVYSEGAILRRRDGITAVNVTAATGVGNGLYNWVRGSATTAQWLIGVWGAGLWKMDIVGTAWDGTWDTIAADTGGTAFTTAGGITYFANFNGVLLISNEGQQHIQKMTVSDASYTNIETGGTGTAPLAKFVLNWKNHAWFLNCLGSEDQVVHSSINSYNNFTGTTYGANNLLTENDPGVTGGFILNGRLYVTKGFSIHRFTYTGSPSPLVDIRTIKSTCGTKSPRSIKNVNTPEGEVVLFLGSNKKLYLCDGQDTQEISDSIDVTNGVATVYMQAINAAAFNNCHAVVHEDLNLYELFLCIGTATTPAYSIVYDYRLKSFWPMKARNFTYGNISYNGAGKRGVYSQGTDGVAYLLNSGNSDNGAAIDAWWTSEKIGVSLIMQRIDEVEVETEAVVVTPTFSWRADWETAWVNQTMKSNQNSHNWSPSRIDNLIQFKIADNSTNPAFKLWTILGNERVVGGGK